MKEINKFWVCLELMLFLSYDFCIQIQMIVW